MLSNHELDDDCGAALGNLVTHLSKGGIELSIKNYITCWELSVGG